MDCTTGDSLCLHIPYLTTSVRTSAPSVDYRESLDWDIEYVGKAAYLLEFTVLYRLAVAVIDAVVVGKFYDFTSKVLSTCGLVDPLDRPSSLLLLEYPFYLCVVVKCHSLSIKPSSCKRYYTANMLGRIYYHREPKPIYELFQR